MRTVFIWCLVVLLSGCSIDPPGEALAPSDPRLLGVSFFYRQDEFYKDLESGVRDAAAELGYRLLVTDAETQVVKQSSQVDHFIHRRVAGMILCCADPNGIVPAIGRANRAGIPVVTLDGSANGGRVVCHVGHDNRACGRAAGQYLVDAARKRDTEELRTVILDYPQSAVVCGARVEGFKEAVGAERRIRILAQQSGEANRVASLRAMSALLQAHPRIDALFAINDDTVLGAMAAAQRAGRLEEIRFVSCTWSSEIFQLLQRPSSMGAAVVTSPYHMATTAVHRLVDHLQGKKVPGRVLVAPSVYTHENIGRLDWRSVVKKRLQ